MVPIPSTTYDPLNRLTGVSSVRPDPSSPARPELVEGLATHTYDGEGKRISSTEGGVTTTYLYDGLLPVLERQGSATTINVWGLSLGGGIGGLLAFTQGGASYFPLYDGSGNILAWTNSTGAVKGTASYTAFGEVVARSGSDPAGSDPFGFSTKAFSSTTGLAYFGARYYRPDLSRWLTPDPLGIVDGPNLYAYVRNSPLSFIDPWGLSTEPGLIDETDVLIDVGNISIGVVISLVDGPAPIADFVGRPLVVKGTAGLAGKGKVVIGETMKRVIARARREGASYYKPTKAVKDIGLRRAIENNKRWLRRQVKAGKEVIDIGLDRKRPVRSVFYEAEQEVLETLGHR